MPTECEPPAARQVLANYLGLSPRLLENKHGVRQNDYQMVFHCMRFGPISSQEDSMTSLNAQEIANRLGALPDWRIDEGVLTRTFHFKDFVASLAFVNRVGESAEAAGHHPDIDIRYNRVRLGMVTHDAGGLTAKDFDLATVADRLV
jgi:4a-hydroxytetrahydrobiopterin dehydratase